MSADSMPDQPRLSERTRSLIADPARKRLLHQMMTASTFEEIGAAIQSQLSWLTVNPDDTGVLGAGKDVAHAFERLCLNLLLAMGYTFFPADGQTGEESLMREPDGPNDQRIAVECIWTYWPAGFDTVRVAAFAVKYLHATEGLLITGAGLNDEACQLAQRLGIRVVDGDELKRLIDTHAPELNEPPQPADWEVELALRLRAEAEGIPAETVGADTSRRQ